MNIFLVVLMLLVYYLRPQYDFEKGTWTSFFVLFSVYIANYLRRFDWSIAGLFLFSSIGGILVFGPFARYSEFGGPVSTALDICSLTAMMSVLFAIVVIHAMSESNYSDIENSFAFIGLFNSCLTIYQFIKHPEWINFGMFGNKSMNANFIAFTYPFLVFKDEAKEYPFKKTKEIWTKYYLNVIWDVFCIVVPLVAIIVSKASIPILAICFVWFGSMFFSKDSILSQISLFFYVAILGIIGVSIYFDWIPDFASSNGRTNIWALAMNYWKMYANPLLGFGLGTTAMFVPHAQEYFKVAPDNMFVHMHSDFLQVLFESGILAFIFLILTWFRMIKICWDLKINYLLLGVLTYGLISMGSFNFNLPLHSLFGAFLCARVFTLKKLRYQ